MTSDISHVEAALAVDAIERRRDEVRAAVDVPRWYWPAMAGGWIGLGLLGDYGAVWVTTVSTVAFGAAHSAVGSRVLSGRHPSSGLSIRGDVVTRWAPAIIVAFLLLMVVVTVGLALALNADGAGHPATFASVVVAALVLSAGPRVMTYIRGLAAGRTRAH